MEIIECIWNMSCKQNLLNMLIEEMARKLMRVIKDNSKNFDDQQGDVSPFTQIGKNRASGICSLGRGNESFA